MKIITVVGARPQFIKSAPLGKALRQAGHHEVLVHTGQHYDYGMSQVFFEEMSIPEPDFNLGIGSGPHGHQTGQMLAALEDVMLAEKPDWVLVYGDTNSTIAGALAAVKLHMRVAHVEAGLRSYNRSMPEEHNRVLTDHCADALFCPTLTAVDNLAKEGIYQGVHRVGDPMFDAVLQFSEVGRRQSKILAELKLESKGYLLATIHRAYNSDDPVHLKGILQAFAALNEPILFPVHPRTRKMLTELGLMRQAEAITNLQMIEPVGYLEMLALEQNARLMLTDSGGMQKEAFFFGVPCVTLRPETEWVETAQSGWNVIAGSDTSRIIAAVGKTDWPHDTDTSIFGDGHACEKIVRILEGNLD